MNIVNKESMKAVVMNDFGGVEKMELKKCFIPEPRRGEVRIRIKAAAFNPVDWKIRENWYGGNPKQILGCDCSGFIDAVGPNEDRFVVGDKVYALAIFKSSNGSYAEYTCVPRELVVKKPEKLTFEEAATVPLAGMTAYRAVIASYAFKEGDSVFVAGLGGGVGSFAIQFLKFLGVKEIYTVAKNIKSSEFLQEKMGINEDHILIYDGLTMDEMKKSLIKMNGDNLFDATLDLVGKDVKKLCLELTGYSGHFTTILPEENFVFPIWNENSIPRGRNLSIHQVSIGAEMASKNRKNWQIYGTHLERISQMLEKDILKPPYFQVIGSLNARTVQIAHNLLKKGRVKGKLVMIIE